MTFSSSVLAENIDPSSDGHKHGWCENAGFLNMEGDSSSSGITVASDALVHGLSGFAWQENCGWLNFGDGTPDASPHYSNTSGSDFGVNLDPATGNLSGLAWGENIGWINFDTLSATGQRVSISKVTGEFSGKAWSENIGWMGFDGLAAHVARTDAAAVLVALSHFTAE